MKDARADDETITRTCEAVEGKRPLDPATRAEFEAILLKARPKVLHVCRRIVRNDATAEEVCQEALLTAFRKLPEWRSQSSLSTWICGIARNLALGRVRRKTEVLTLSEEGTDGEPVFEPASPEAGVLREIARAERDEIVRVAVAALPDAVDREILELAYVEALPHATIASILGVEAGDVRNALYRGRRALRAALRTELTSRGHTTQTVGITT